MLSFLEEAEVADGDDEWVATHMGRSESPTPMPGRADMQQHRARRWLRSRTRLDCRRRRLG